MLKPSLALAIGLSASITAATADELPYPTNPVPTEPHLGISVYDSPSFGRLLEMCADVGFDCSAPGDVHGNRSDLLSPRALADYQKAQALRAEELAALAERISEQFGPYTVPVLPRHYGPFGYHAPRTLPYPNIDLYQFGHRLPTVPRIQVPHGYSFPRGVLPHAAIRNNPVFPWPSL